MIIIVTIIIIAIIIIINRQTYANNSFNFYLMIIDPLIAF